jgi:hypothetical protein
MYLLIIRPHEVSDLACDAGAFAATMAKRSKKGQGDWAVGFSDAATRFRAAWPKKGMTKEDRRLLEIASDGLAVAELSEFASLCQRRRQRRPQGGAKPGQLWDGKRHGARACRIACAGHAAFARRAKALSRDQVLGGVFWERLWPSR